MASAPKPDDFFDIKKIRRLAELMKDLDLSELDLQQAETRLRIRRKLEADPVAEMRPMMPASPVASTPTAKPAADNALLVKSPMVGTFYVSPNPESPAFVKVGDHVGKDTVVCIIEAMKVFNEIPAEVAGKIVAVLVENGEPVEFGQPLFKVDPNQ
jgi:acetyl-CoA carboxylase biotin carboxyl carrier protein